MNRYRPRRPAQLKPGQIDLIEGGVDIAYSSELAHAGAQAVVPLPTAQAVPEEVIARVSLLIDEEGVDALADFWAESPAETLPGILWRGFLLREWIRRDFSDAERRFAAASAFFATADPQRISLVPRPETVKAQWDEVFKGNFRGDFAEVLRISARFTDFTATVAPIWITEDTHPLATEVTRRNMAMLRTAREFKAAGEMLTAGNLE